MSRRPSRPSSAASHASSRSSAGDSEFKLECKAAFLSIYDDLRDVINSEEDLSTALQQAGRNPSKKTLSRYWREDTDYLSFEDFVSICRNEPVTTSDDLMKAFRKIDINGDGYISLDELQRMLTTRGERMSRQEVKEIIDEVDENGDGKLDYKEFCTMLLQTTEECKKMSMRLMEKKERNKRKGRSDGSATPRRGEDHIHGSRTSLRSNSSAKLDGRAPSHSSLRSVGRTGSKSSLISVDDMPRPSPRVRKDKVQQPVGTKRLSEPSNLREYTHTSSKGCFFIDEEGVISHQYTLDLPSDTRVFITIHPLRIADAGFTDDGPVDTALFVLREKSSSVDRVVTFTDKRDSKGRYGVCCDLSAGRYRLIPFTTGCRFRERSNQNFKEVKLIKKDKDDKIVLTTKFKRALEDIFEMVDMDGNGLLNREEFSWYNMRTSGEHVADDEWEVVEGNVELEHDEITKAGFVHLNQMEADDNEGDADDLWVTVSSMGFNRALILDQACPFKIDLYTEDCDDAELKVVGLEAGGEQLDDAICESVMSRGEVSRVKNMKDLCVYTYIGESRATVVVDNKSYSKVRLELDCSKSKNVVSNHRDLHVSLTVPSNTTMIGHHMIPRDERSDWVIRCQESIHK